MPADSVFTPDELARARAWAAPARYLAWSHLLLQILLALGLAMSARVRNGLGRLPGPWWVQTALAVALLQAVGWVVTAPLAVVSWRRAVSYGLSTRDWQGWLLDQGLSWTVTWLTTAVVLLVLFGCVRKLPRTWPLAAGGVLAGLVVAGSWTYPMVVEPLFNDFRPLPAGNLRTAVTELADREGVKVSDVVVADASRRTTTLNAWVSGFGSSRRVVLYDTLVEDVPQDETLAVVGHELAHAKHNDVLVGTVLGAVAVMAAAGALGVAARSRLAPPKDVRAVPVLLAVAVVGSILSAPVTNGISRLLETRADVVGLGATGDVVAVEKVQRSLAVRSLSDPTGPEWSQWWFGSHPSVLDRIAVARRLTGGPPRIREAGSGNGEIMQPGASPRVASYGDFCGRGRRGVDNR